MPPKAKSKKSELGASRQILAGSSIGHTGEDLGKILGGSVKTMIATKEIAPYGDIMIEIPSTAGTARLKVASQVLCAASPVFRAMLGPSSSFREACELRTKSPNVEPYRLVLDDNPEALGVILLALHCQNSLVPKNVTFKNLVDLAIICDKYDCATGVSLWVDIWTKPWIESATKPGHEHWLFVAWTFGIQDVFEKLSKHIILKGRYSTEDPTLFITGEGFCLDEMLVPEAIMEAIRKRRGTVINSMSESTYSYQERYMTPWGKALCKASSPTEACDATILGSIMKGFRSLGIATDFGEFVLKSIEDMEKGIIDLRIEFMPISRSNINRGYCNHSYCSNCSNQTYCNSCGSYYSNCYCGSNHGTTCSFLPELHAKIRKDLEEVKGLRLDDFKPSKAKSLEAKVAKWDLFEYK